jgi:hypothetical protein
LTDGYRFTYWVLFAVTILSTAAVYSHGGIGYPGGFGIAIALALIRDWQIRSRVMAGGQASGVPASAQKEVRPDSTTRQYGIYKASGELLTLPEAFDVITRFDEKECEALLRSFDHRRGSGESLSELRLHCIEVLKETRAYAT